MSLDVYLEVDGKKIYEANITHNLTNMASEADIYKCLWRPDENGMTKARHIIPALQDGLLDMLYRPSYYQEFDADNGWGTYENFLPFCAKYLEACVANPDAEVRVFR